MKGKKLALELVKEINNALGFDFCRLSSSNGFHCIRNNKTNEDITPSDCGTIRENIIFLRAYKSGIYKERIKVNERIFLVVDSRGNSQFCTLHRLNSICSLLNEGYFSIFDLWNNKPKKLTKKALKSILEANEIKQEFFY